MGITERKERERHEMRQRIITAAMGMFLQEGYERTSIRNIAEKIEYSPATIYLYYKDKDELLYEVQREAFDKLDAALAEVSSIKDSFKRLRALSKRYVQFGLENHELYDLMFILKSPMKSIEEHDEWSNCEDSFGFLLATIDDCLEQGQIRFKDRMIAAFSVWSHVHGMVALCVRGRMKVTELTDDQNIALINKAIDQFMDIIKA